jgi:anti-sigma regulatory factor (Ser/Thr protein kinase)
MDLFQHLGFDYKEQFNRHNETGRFIPLRLIRDFTDVTQATDDICELVIHQFENAHEFLPALEWAVNEVIDNVYNHACISTPAAICGQYYPKNKRLEIAIVDSGRGIKASLAESFDLPNDEAALGKAMQRGITRNKDEGQGNGLAGTREIVLKNGGSLRLWSGNSQYHISKGVEQGFHTIPYMQGTGVLIKLNTEQPVDLSDTFIGETDWSYINVLCEEIEEAGSLKVSEEVINTFTREAGRRLRLKIDSLLPEMEGPLVLDFQGIDMATSSFMDELFGKLYLKYGDDYSIRIKAININTILQSILSMTLYDRAEKQI